MRSQRACQIIGCTFRQLDYLTRTQPALAGMNNGSGSRRTWDSLQVVRLAIAYQVASVLADTSSVSGLPEIARAALDPDLPEPVRNGYAVLIPDPLEMRWAATWADVRTAVDGIGAAVVVAYDLDVMLGGRMDVDAWADMRVNACVAR
jgi:hypothetical protein